MNLDDVKSGFNLETINSNFQQVEDALNNSVLHRKPIAGQDNKLEVNLDMNGKRLYNTAFPESPLDVVRLVDIQTMTGSGGGTAAGVSVNTNQGIPGPTVQDSLQEIWDKLTSVGYEAARAYYIASGHNIAILEVLARMAQIEEELANTGTGVAGTTDEISYGVGGRILTDVLDDMYINVKDYGAKGDGSTNDTVAIQAAYEAAYAKKKNLYFPAGQYMTTGLKFNYTYLTSLTVEGAGWGITTIEAIQGTTAPVLELSHPTDPQTIGPNEMTFRGIHFKGNYPETYSPAAPNLTSAAVWMNSGFVMAFEDCWFSHARHGFYNYRGVLDRFNRCTFSNSEIGMRILGAYGTTSYMQHCDAKNNFVFGLHCDESRHILFEGGSIENNGIAGNAGTGGVFVGNLTGQGGVAQTGRSLTIKDSWIEYNHGHASVWLSGGVNTIEGCIFSYHDGTVTNMIRVSGGLYHFHDNVFETNRANHVLEDASGTVLVGNTILDCIIASNAQPINVSVSEVKTRISRGLDSAKINWDQSTGYIQMKKPTQFQSLVRMDGTWTTGAATIAGYIPININGNNFRLGVYGA